MKDKDTLKVNDLKIADPVEKLILDYFKFNDQLDYANGNEGQEYYATLNTRGEKLSNYKFLPKNKSLDNLNTIFYIRGSAFQSEIGVYKKVASHICEYFQCEVVMVRHSVGEKHKFPTPYNEICATIKEYMLQNRDAQKKIALLGDSSGGLLALLFCLNNIQHSNPIDVSQLILFAPAVDFDALTNLLEKPEDGLKPRFFAAAAKVFKSKIDSSKSWRMSPAHHSDNNLSRLPPVTIIYGENDILSSSIIKFISRLNALGVKVRGIPFKGGSHYTIFDDIVPQINNINVKQRVEKLFHDSKPFSIARLPQPERTQAFVSYDMAPVFKPDQNVSNEKIQQAISDWFNQRCNRTLYMILHGQSGIGKTQILTEAYYKIQKESKLNCIWCNASNLYALQNSLYGFLIKNGENRNIDLREVCSIFKKFIEDHEQQFLLVLDNLSPNITLTKTSASQQSGKLSISDFVPIALGRVLITALDMQEHHNDNLPEITHYEVESMEPEACEELIKKRGLKTQLNNDIESNFPSFSVWWWLCRLVIFPVIILAVCFLSLLLFDVPIKGKRLRSASLQAARQANTDILKNINVCFVRSFFRALLPGFLCLPLSYFYEKTPIGLWQVFHYAALLVMTTLIYSFMDSPYENFHLVWADTLVNIIILTIIDKSCINFIVKPHHYNLLKNIGMHPAAIMHFSKYIERENITRLIHLVRIRETLGLIDAGGDEERRIYNTKIQDQRLCIHVVYSNVFSFLANNPEIYKILLPSFLFQAAYIPTDIFPDIKNYDVKDALEKSYLLTYDSEDANNNEVSTFTMHELVKVVVDFIVTYQLSQETKEQLLFYMLSQINQANFDLNSQYALLPHIEHMQMLLPKPTNNDTSNLLDHAAKELKRVKDEIIEHKKISFFADFEHKESPSNLKLPKLTSKMIETMVSCLNAREPVPTAYF